MSSSELLIFYATPTAAEVKNGGYQCESQSAMGILWNVGLATVAVDGKEMMRVTVRGTKNKNNNNTTSSWRAVIQTRISIPHPKFRKESPHQNIDGRSTCATDVDWANLIRPSNPSDGSLRISLFIHLTVIECIFNTDAVTRKRKMGYSTQSPITDFALVVEGQKIYVGRQFLATFSPFFNTLFYGDFAEKEKNEIELRDVNYEDFMVLLDILYPTDQPLNDSNVEGVLKLSDQFEIKIVLSRVENFLKESTTIPLSKKLLLSDRYALSSLKAQCLAQLTDKVSIRRLMKSSEYQELSSDLKVKILEKLA